MKKKLLLLPLLLLVPLAACGKEEEADDALVSYTLGGDTIPAMEQVLTEQTGGRLVATLTPDSGSEDGGEDGEAQDEEPADGGDAAASPDYISYDYQQFAEGQAAGAAEAYAALLEDEDNQLTADGEPDYTARTGSVTLYRQAVATDDQGAPVASASATADSAKDEGDKADEEAETALPYASYEHNGRLRFQVRLDWTPTSCLVTLENTEGEDFSTSLLEAGQALSFSGAKALLQTLAPAEIGLPGKSMDEYSLKPGPGFVMVDGRACLTVYVYGKNAEGTNSLLGTYFISSDGTSLYRQTGQDPREVERVKLYENTPADSTDSGAKGAEDAKDDKADE